MRRIPWRLLLVLVILAVAAVFAGLNLEPVNVSVGFHVFENIPLFLALIVAYIVGALSVLPFAFASRKPRPGAGAKPEVEEGPREAPEKVSRS